MIRNSPHSSSEVVANPLDPADSRYREFRFLLGYWNRLRGPRIGPSRREIDPVELKRVLPRLALVDVLSSRKDLRFRLVGTDIHNLHNCDLTGRLVSHLRPDAYRDMLLEHFLEVAATGRPNAHEVRFVTAAGLSRHYAALRLPLSTDGQTVDCLLTIDNYGDHWSDLHPYFDSLYERAGRS